MQIFWGCYWNFCFLIKVVSPCGIVFRKCKCFPIWFLSKRKWNLPFSRCYINNLTWRYVWSTNITHDSQKRWRRILQFLSFKSVIALYIVITISLIIRLFQKKPKLGGSWGYTFLKSSPGILYFFTLTLKVPGKTKFNPWIFHKIVLDPLEIPRPKAKTPWNSTLVFLGHPWKFHFVFN